MRELTFFPLPAGTYRKSSGYGIRVNPITGAPGTFHRGCDYAASTGTPVFAPFDGQVTSGYEAGGAGNWIWVVNGPDMFKSFHHSAYEVRSGFVRAGDVIAYIGTTGASTGSHGHFELWENGRNIDPTAYLDRAPVKGATSAPTPITPLVTVPEEDDDVKTICWDDGGAWVCWGLFRRSCTEKDLNAYRFFGVKDIGKNADFLEMFTPIPRDGIS